MPSREGNHTISGGRYVSLLYRAFGYRNYQVAQTRQHDNPLHFPLRQPLGKTVLKGTRWLILENPENLDDR